MKTLLILCSIVLLILLLLGAVVSCQQQAERITPTPTLTPTPTPTPTLTPAPTPTPTSTPTATPGKFEILSHSMSIEKDGMPVVSIQVKNTGGSIIDSVKVTVKFLDSAGEVLFTVSTYKYNIATGQTYNFEVAPDPMLLLLSIYKEPTNYKIEYKIMY